jgi:glycine oxidase
MASYDVVIVGSGVIGLSVAWRVGETNRRVAIFDPAPGRGSSYAAAGMLAPVTEAAWGEEALIRLNVRAGAAWEHFADELQGQSGLRLGYETQGTLLVACDASDRAYLEELLDFQHHLGLNASWYGPTACRDLVPLLAPGIRGGIFAPQDHRVDNRRLLAALELACEKRGVEIHKSRVDEVLSDEKGVYGIRCGTDVVRAPVVIIAAGVSSFFITGVPQGALPPIRPVKGQILRLRTALGDPLLNHAVRALVHGHSVYIVPRPDGRIAIGATVEEKGDDTTVTAGAIYELLRDALQVLPSLSEVEFTEALAGLRPGSPDNAPIIGPTTLPGLIVAAGHYRNGILHAPLTSEAVTYFLEKGELPDWCAPIDSRRFSSNTTRHIHSI